MSRVWLASPKRRGKPVTKNFFISAMALFEKILPNDEILYIVASDDYEYCIRTFIHEMKLDNVIMANQGHRLLVRDYGWIKVVLTTIQLMFK